MAHDQIITRRHLPHWYVPHAAHFVTYRLAGTIPLPVLEALTADFTARLQQPPPAGQTGARFKERLHKRFFAEYDRYLDTNNAIDWLARPPVAAVIRGNLYHHHGVKYHLLAYVIMPNHIHVLFQPIIAPDTAAATAEGQARLLVPTEEGSFGERADAKGPLASIMHSLKSYTANQANRLLDRSGQFWQHESYDHWVRDDDELQRIVDYIAWNPVRAKLVAEPQLWFFSSAHDRFLQDGSTMGFLTTPE